jgi:hypothetical protein
MKRLPTSSGRGTSDVDLCAASPKRVPTGPQDLFSGRKSAVSDSTPVRVRQVWAWFTETDVQSISNGPAMELTRVKWEMSVNSEELTDG